ncbi:MAG: DUF5681 domain-containing protein [Terricaulis sp.]
MSDHDTKKKPDDDEEIEVVGPGNPPVSGRFKKGQSGCPDGGWKQRRARQKVKEEKAAKKEESIAETLKRVAGRMRKVTVGGKPIEISTIEALVMRLSEQALAGDIKSSRTLISLLKDTGQLKAPLERNGGGVLVVYPIMKQQEWIDATEGDHHLTKDPLDGLLTEDEEKRHKAAMDSRGRRKLNEDGD